MTNNSKKHSYVNINDNLRYFLNSYELSFLIRLKHLAHLRSVGLRTAFAKEANFRSFQINRTLFYQAVNRLESLGLMKRVKVKRYVDYQLNEESYDRLLEIATSTSNHLTLLSFSENEFIQKKRSILSISDTEIMELKDKK